MNKDEKEQFMALVIDNEKIIRFFLQQPFGSITQLEKIGGTGLAYSTLVKRVAYLKQNGILAQTHRIKRDGELDILKVLFRYHYFIGIIVNPEVVYKSKGKGQASGKRSKKEILLQQIMREVFIGNEDVVVVSATMIWGPETEIILNVYCKEEPFELIEEMRGVEGVHSTRTYQVSKDLRYTDLYQFDENSTS